MLGLLGGALFAGLLLLEAFELTAALFRLPLFPALSPCALARLLWVCRGRLRIRLTLIGPDGGTLRLGLVFCMDGRKTDGVGRFLIVCCLRVGLAAGRRGEPDSLARRSLRRLLPLRPAAELVHDLLKRVFRLLRRRRFRSGLRRLIQLCFVLRTPGWFHTVLPVL